MKKYILLRASLRSAALIFIVSIALASCGSSRHWANRIEETPDSLHYLNTFVYPYNQKFKGTVIGGLSDIDYNPAKKEYYLISDDRSELSPARFYTAQIAIGDTGISQVRFTDVTLLKRADGSFYPNRHQDKYQVPDPEALRYNPKEKSFYWSSEGERIVSARDTVIEDPSVNIADRKGKLKYSLFLPQKFRMTPVAMGPRQNVVFEGLGFQDNYTKLIVSLEEPLYPDGPVSDTFEQKRFVRFLQWDLKTRKPIAEFAYHTDPVPYTPTLPNGERINGISSILPAGKNKVLVIERAFAAGHKGNVVKIYLADFSQATNVKNISSLLSTDDFIPVSKKLLFNTEWLGRYIDNIEGISFGPRLPNGHRSLLLEVDNNFNSHEQMQFLAFEIIPYLP